MLLSEVRLIAQRKGVVIDMAPKLSVVVPVYNVENYLSKCLDSILKQTLEDIEIICVNDGSTDGSANILQDYKKKDPRIIVLEQENQGLGAARNTGIRTARGEYIGFVDSDDFIEPTMYEKLYEKACKFQLDIVLTNVNLYYTDSGTSACFRDWNFYQAMSKSDYFTAMEHPHIFQFIGVWDRIYRRKFLEEHSLLNPVNRIYEDVLFTVQTCIHAKKISIVNECLYYYRKNTGRSIVDKERENDSYKFDFLKNLKESRDFLILNQKWEQVRKEFLAFQFQGILYHQYNTQTRKTFILFMSELSEILPLEDIQIIEDMVSDRAGHIYLYLLRKKKFSIAYVLYKLRKLYQNDNWYFYFRFPRCKKYWKIRKFGYRWKCEIQSQYDIAREIKQLSNLQWELIQEIKKLRTGDTALLEEDNTTQ